MNQDFPDGNDGRKELVVPSSQAARVLLDGLNWVYDRAVGGGFGFSGAEETAKAYRAEAESIEDAINSLIRWQVAKASAAGFVSNIGGLITLPVAIPANLVGVLFIQLNMVASIASMRGYDTKSDRVRTFAQACLVGSGAVDLIKDVGVQVGSKLASQALMAVSGNTLIRINQMVGFRLVTKAGATGVVNLSKLVPFVGGLVGGAIDGSATAVIGGAAKMLFPTVSSGASGSGNATEG